MLVSPEELDPFRQLLLTDQSYSRLNTYVGCGAKFYYSYIAEEERTFGPAAALGNVIHGVLAEADFDVLSADDMIAAMPEQIEIYDPEGLISDELIEAGKQMLIEFCDRHKGEEFRIISREEWFELVSGTALFRGAIDQVLFDDNGGVRIRDWKSGKWEVAQKNVAKDLQLGLYALVAEYLYPDLRPITVELYYLRSGKQKCHTFTEEDLRAAEERLVALTDEHMNTNIFQFTSNKNECIRLCDFGKNGVCPRGATVIRNMKGKRW